MTDSMTPEKKGLSGLAIAGIGCGTLVLITMIVAALLLMKGCEKLKEVAGDFEKNPAKAAAMLVVKANPEVELVSSNDERGEITIRDKSSGEMMTMSFNDVAEGRFTVRKGDEVITLDASEAERGRVVVSGPDGQMILGSHGSVGLPTWVPAYPGLEAQPGGMKSETASKVSGMVVATVTAPVTEVKDFYEKTLKEQGFETEVNLMNFNGVDSATVVARKDGESRVINVVINVENGRTNVLTNYEGPPVQ